MSDLIKQSKVFTPKPSGGGAAVTLTAGTTGTDFNIDSTGAPSYVFNLPTASASARGALSSSDWTTFNNKIGGSLTSGRVPYASGASTLTDTSLFVFDGTKLGVGIASPTATGHFKGSDSTSSNYALKIENSSAFPSLNVDNLGRTALGYGSAYADSRLYVLNQTSPRTYAIYVDSYVTHGVAITQASSSGGRALYVSAAASGSSSAYGAEVYSQGTTTGGNYGGLFQARNAVTSVGVWGNVDSGNGTETTNIGVWGTINNGNGPVGGSYRAVYGQIQSLVDGATAYAGYFRAVLAGGTSRTMVAGYFEAGSAATNYAIITNGGNSGFGITAPTAMVHIKGSDSTSSNYALKVDNSSSSAMLYVRNDKRVAINTTTFTGALNVQEDGTSGYIAAFRNNAASLLVTLENNGGLGFGVTGVAAGVTIADGYSFRYYSISEGGNVYYVQNSGVRIGYGLSNGGFTGEALTVGNTFTSNAATETTAYIINETTAKNKFAQLVVGAIAASGFNRLKFKAYSSSAASYADYGTIESEQSHIALIASTGKNVYVDSTTGSFIVPRMTSTQGSALTAVNGGVIYVTDTNGTFTSVGFWGYENGAWVKL